MVTDGKLVLGHTMKEYAGTQPLSNNKGIYIAQVLITNAQIVQRHIARTVQKQYNINIDIIKTSNWL